MTPLLCKAAEALNAMRCHVSITDAGASAGIFRHSFERNSISSGLNQRAIRPLLFSSSESVGFNVQIAF